MSATIIPFPRAHRRVPSLVMTAAQRAHLADLAADKGADRDTRAAAVHDLIAAALPGSASEHFWSIYGQNAGLFAPAGMPA